MKGTPSERDVLIVTDPQRDFCPGGALAAPDGDAVMPAINRLARHFAHGGFTRVTLCGLATDFCVFFSAIDAREAGFGTAVVLEASRAIDLDGSLARALAVMREAGVELL